ncbi:MAG: DNA translocase FtsK [Schwartzia sp.]|nr:DNA translocase FtsK [Schwartzia sp. (in: firmicutes)]
MKKRGKNNNTKSAKTTRAARASRRSSRKSREPENVRVKELIGLVLCVIAVISACGLLDFNVGFVGIYFARFFEYFLGIGTWIAIIALFALGVCFIARHKGVELSRKSAGFFVFFCLCLAIYHHSVVPAGEEILPHSLAGGGGLLGGGVLFVIRKFFGVDGGLIVLGAGALGSLLLATKWSLASGIKKTAETAQSGIAIAQKTIENTYEKYERNRERKIDEKKRSELFYDQEKDDNFAGAIGIEGEPQPYHDEGYDEYIEQYARENAAYNFEAEQQRESIATNNDNDEGNASAGSEAQAAFDNGQIVSGEESLAGSEDSRMIHGDGNENAVNDGPGTSAGAPFPIEYASSSKTNETHEPPARHIQTSLPEYDIDSPRKTEKTEGLIDVFETQTINNNEENAAPVAPPLVAAAPAPPATERGGDESDGEQEKEYVMPSVTEILDKHKKSSNFALELEIQENAQTLSQTLENFKVKVNIVNACHGPAVTRYELEPAPGVKVSKITNLSDDIALALAASAVRIEPIQGKAAIGVEVPNKELEGVMLRDVLENQKFAAAKSKLTVGLGMDIGGQAIFADIAKMPHLLVAGATGSGKSVCVNTIIASILFKARPDEVKFILIDPKMVELSNYNGIPHLMVPVVTDSRKAASVLNWAVQEMEKRYSRFAEAGVRNIEGYNQKMEAEAEKKLPSIVLIIDELADLMMVAPHDVEDAICRIAQKARAAGMHLVLATQRPSVDVITGIIKANIPSRISFAVSSQIDSRTILDMSGAEKLLGKGDMLFCPVGASKPTRVQGAFISDEEVERLLDFIRAQCDEPEPDEEIISFTEQEAEEKEDKKEKKEKKKSPPMDDLLVKAVELVMGTGQASASSIQRKFHVGYTRAGRLIDTMESLGIVGPSMGSKPREILMTSEQAMEAIDNCSMND